MITLTEFETYLKGRDDILEPETVEVVRDPQVSGTYAARATALGGGTLDFLICQGIGDEGMDVEDLLEECVFTAWPPASGDLKFFV